MYLAPPQGVIPSEFRVKMFDADKTRMIALPYGGKNYDNNSRSHLLPERHGRTDRIAISISRVSVLTRDKNRLQA